MAFATTPVLIMVLHCVKPIIKIIINNASLVKPAQMCSKYAVSAVSL